MDNAPNKRHSVFISIVILVIVVVVIIVIKLIVLPSPKKGTSELGIIQNTNTLTGIESFMPTLTAQPPTTSSTSTSTKILVPPVAYKRKYSSSEFQPTKFTQKTPSTPPSTSTGTIKDFTTEK